MDISIKKNLYWNTLLRIPVKFLGFICSIIVARLLDPSDFGIMAIAMMAIGYANIITNFGLNEAIIQRSIYCAKTLSSILTIDLIISFILTVLFVCGATTLSDFFHERNAVHVIQVMSLYFLVSSFYGISHAILRRDMRFSTLAVLEISQSLAISSLTLILALLNFGYWSLAIGQIVPMLIFSVLFCVKARWKPQVSYTHKLVKPVFHFGLWNFLKSQINYFIVHIDKILIGRMIGSHALGLYDKAKNIAAMPSELVLININSVMFSSFSRSKNNIDELNKQFKKAMSLICVVSCPFYVGLILIAPYFVSTVLGKKWTSMVVPFQIILLGYIFKSFGGILASFNVGIGKYKAHTLRLFVAGFFFVVLCLLLVDRGIEGIAWAFTIFCFIEFYLSLSIAMIKFNINIFTIITYVYTGLWSSLVMFLGVYYLAFYILLKRNLINMILLIIAGIGCYILCLAADRGAVWKSLRREFVSDMKLMVSKLFSAKNV